MAVMLSPTVLDTLEDLEDVRQADKAMAAYEHDPSGAITLDDLKANIRDAVECHFDAAEMPRMVRLAR